MSLRRALLGLVIVATGRLLRAEDLRVDLNTYNSADGLSVTSPSVNTGLDLDPRTKLSLRYTLDAVSAASYDYARGKTHAKDPARAPGTCFNCHTGVDAMSGATRDYRETRQQVDFGVRRRVDESEAKAGYTRSQENDYLSEALSVGGSLDFFGRNTTVSLSGTRMSDASTAVWKRSVTRSLLTHGVDLGLTQVLGRGTQARWTLAYADAQGYLADPYAFVQIANNTSQPLAARHPEGRQRLDAVMAFKQALPLQSAFELDYRYYQDSWEVRGHTVEFALSAQRGDWLLEPSYRWYGQSQAYFFKNAYAQDQPYISRDLKLAALTTQMLGVELRGKLSEDVTLSLRYSRYTRQDELDYRLYFADRPSEGVAYQAGLTFE